MDTFSDYEDFDGLGLAGLVKGRVVSPLELLNAAIERIERKNPSLNAVIYKMYDEAHASLQTALPEGPFQGVPFLLKDLLADCAGIPMQCGSPGMRNIMSQRRTVNWLSGLNKRVLLL